MPSKREYLALLAILASAAAARFAWLSAKGFWIDELFTLDFVQSVLRDWPSAKFVLTSGRPVYFVLSAPVLALVGDPAWSIRAVSAAAGVAGVALLWRLGRDDQDSGSAVLPLAGLAAAALAVLHPFHLFLSREGRYYSLFFALVAAAVWAHRRLVRSPTFPRAAALALVLAVGMHTHLFFGAVVLAWLALDAIRFLRHPARRSAGIRASAFGYLLFGLANLPLNAYGARNLLRGLTGGPAAHTTLSSTLGSGPQAHFEFPWSVADPELWAGTTRLFLGDHPLTIAGSLVLAAVGLRLARTECRPWLAYGASILVATAIPLLLVRSSHPIVPRYFVGALPFLFLIEGLAVARAFAPDPRPGATPAPPGENGSASRGPSGLAMRLSPPALRRIVGTALLLVALGQALSLQAYVQADHQGWRDAFRRVEREAARGDEIWVFRDWQRRMFEHVSGRADARIRVLPVLSGEDGLRQAGKLLREACARTRVWYVQVSYRLPPEVADRFEVVERFPVEADLEPLTLYRSREP